MVVSMYVRVCPPSSLGAAWHARCLICFFFNDTATTEIYTLSLHDALPILVEDELGGPPVGVADVGPLGINNHDDPGSDPVDVADEERSEEHTSELQSLAYLVCRLLLEKKNSTLYNRPPTRG